MNLDQQARWQHGVLLVAVVGCLAGGMIFAIGLASSMPNAAPWWVGAIVFCCAAGIGLFGMRSLRQANAKTEFTALLARGMFELPLTTAAPIARINERLMIHFGLSHVFIDEDDDDAPSSIPVLADGRRHAQRATLPATVGELVAAMHKRVRLMATVKPTQFDAARAMLAEVVQMPVEEIDWSARPAKLMPSGRQRRQSWNRIRAAAPTLPPVTLNPWIENIAIYGFFAALIAIAVPIAKRFDSDNATRIQPTVENRLIGKAVGFVVFGSIIAVLMVPVYLIGVRFASRLPADADELGTLARHFPLADDVEVKWKRRLVADHVRALVAAELGIGLDQVNDETKLG